MTETGLVGAVAAIFPGAAQAPPVAIRVTKRLKTKMRALPEKSQRRIGSCRFFHLCICPPKEPAPLHRAADAGGRRLSCQFTKFEAVRRIGILAEPLFAVIIII